MIEGVIVEEVPVCDCIGDELERGRVCDEPHCPNRKENT